MGKSRHPVSPARRFAPNQRSPEHFIANIDLEDGPHWVPYADGVGRVRGFTMRGQWRYLEHDWVAKPGTFIYEPAGEAHRLVITDDSSEPALIFFAVEGGLIYLDKAVDGGFAAYEDGFTALELARKYYREAGLDVRKLDALVR